MGVNNGIENSDTYVYGYPPNTGDYHARLSFH